jgi:ribonuclease R
MSYLNDERIPSDQGHLYEKKAIHATEREIEAAEAERASIKYKQIEYMSAHIGEIFTGIISGLTERGMFVAEETTRAEGMIKLRDMSGDLYDYNPKNLSLSGKQTGRILRVGDKIKIRVKSVDIEKELLDYEMLE